MRPSPRLLLTLFPGLILLALGCVPAQAQSPEGRARFLHWMAGDASALARDVVPRAPLLLLSGAAVLYPISFSDASVSEEMQEAYHGAFGDFLDVANEFGSPRMTLYVSGVFAASLFTKNSRFQDAAFTSLQSVLYAGVISYGLKTAFGRERPFESDAAHDFDPFSGHSSFPSGHATAAFAALTPWVLYYPHPLTYGLFVLSTGTAMARIALRKHWTTDVLAGSAIGFATAYYLTRRHLGPEAGGRLSITPVAAPDAFALSVRLSF
ncbi:phosphatase PAP2 family protein [Rhodocaloribacter sp.]